MNILKLCFALASMQSSRIKKIHTRNLEVGLPNSVLIGKLDKYGVMIGNSKCEQVCFLKSYQLDDDEHDECAKRRVQLYPFNDVPAWGNALYVKYI